MECGAVECGAVECGATEVQCRALHSAVKCNGVSVWSTAPCSEKEYSMYNGAP